MASLLNRYLQMRVCRLKLCHKRFGTIETISNKLEEKLRPSPSPIRPLKVLIRPHNKYEKPNRLTI